MPAASPARCADPACNRYARETGFCVRHSRQARPVDQSGSTDDLAERKAVFTARIAAGDYKELFGSDLARIIRQASDDAGIDDEVGALRYALAYVLQTETDPVRLAQAVSKLSAASISAARTRKLISGQTADALTESITNILLELQP